MSMIRVMSFNVFVTSLLEEEIECFSDIWANRAAFNTSTIKRYRPDLIGFQEFDAGHWERYQHDLSDYATHFSDPFGGMVGTAIFWKPERFERLASGTFWLSRAPETPGADWGADSPLTASWVRLRCRDSNAQFLHLNTHLDDESELSRVESGKLILARLAALQGDEALPNIVTGDFNCNPWSPVYQMFLEQGFTDTYRAAGHADSVDSSTFHGFRGTGYFALEWGGSVFWRVDWILTRNGARRLQTLSCTIARDAEPPLYASDHYPVVTELLLL
jgi:endonuclease/exonuclease/phosphatase family metal-dependent hydrolase